VTGGVPAAVSVSPSSGAGSSLINFTFTVSDSSAATNLSLLSMLFTTGAPVNNAANECSVLFNIPTNSVGLLADNGTTVNTKYLGSAANLDNSQCAVGYTGFTVSGTVAQFTVQLLFFPANFGGPKTVYLEANEPSSTTGWVSVGTWTVQ
jgi:hypothetical protein